VFSTTYSGSGTPVSYFWDFGDGTYGNQATETHTYTANGTYPVYLTITFSDSCVANTFASVPVNCNGTTCNADFGYWVDPNCYFNFMDSSTTSGTNIVSWYWDFGDGTSSTSQYPNQYYSSNGSYNVCLTITTVDSCTSTICQVVQVGCIGQSTCQANFIAQNNCPLFYFIDNSTASSNIVNWSWDYGDGNTSIGQTGSNTYGANGTYLVCLTITTVDSCTSTYCDSVVVTCNTQPGSCGAGFAYIDNCPVFAFTDTSWSTGNITSVVWDFGDGTTSKTQKQKHTYGTNGT